MAFKAQWTGYLHESVVDLLYLNSGVTFTAFCSLTHMRIFL